MTSDYSLRLCSLVDRDWRLGVVCRGRIVVGVFIICVWVWIVRILFAVVFRVVISCWICVDILFFLSVDRVIYLAIDRVIYLPIVTHCYKLYFLFLETMTHL